jgi:hypothetical protein
MALAGIGDGGRAGAEQPLKLVGAKRLDRCEAGQQQRGTAIKPPPPAIESTKPAVKPAAKQQQGERQRKVFHEIAWGKWCL